jgi:hypothetical protein
MRAEVLDASFSVVGRAAALKALHHSAKASTMLTKVHSSRFLK